MALVLIRKTAPTAAWVAALQQTCPDLEVRVWPDVGAVEEVEFVLCWSPGAGDLARFPNLRAIFSLGVGVDHIFKDPTVPDVPVARMIDPMQAARMAQYVCHAVLDRMRDGPALRAGQRAGEWTRLVPRTPERVGILGLGDLGMACATALAGLGIEVAGWNRSPRTLAGVETFIGAERFDAFLARTDILVCLLPLTPELHGILGRETFAKLPRGAFVINVGRGEHLVEEDLIAALDSGQLGGAVLDVFRKEPLPADHPFWTRPDVVVTPHIASVARPETAVHHVAANIARARAGEPLAGEVARERGY